jgi:hypothetical protein
VEFFAIRQQCTAKGQLLWTSRFGGFFSRTLAGFVSAIHSVGDDSLVYVDDVVDDTTGPQWWARNFVKKWCYFTHYCLSVTDF